MIPIKALIDYSESRDIETVLGPAAQPFKER
jgi:hypothetical protein